MIAYRIYKGETHEEIGIPAHKYRYRKQILDKFLKQWDKNGDFKEDFLAWLPKYNEEFNRGLGEYAYMRENKPTEVKPTKPTVSSMAKGFASAVKNHAKSGFKNADPQTVEQRVSICSECDKMGSEGVWKNRCMVCGCFMKVKAKWASSKCPLDKW